MNSLRSSKKFRWGLSLIGLLIIFLVAPVTLRAQDSAEDNYNKKCAVCHAKDGSGNTAKGKKSSRQGCAREHEGLGSGDDQGRD